MKQNNNLVNEASSELTELPIISEAEIMSPPYSAAQALKLLQEGNKRFIEQKFSKKDLSDVKRQHLLSGQNPFAIILSCSDSRVPPEIIFDQGLGDLFVIRVAGNVDDASAIGSIEYAAEHLNVPLLVVMGHSKCGAVKATLEGGDVSPNIYAIAEKIQPAIDRSKKNYHEKEDILENAVVENVNLVMQRIASASDIVRHLIKENKFKIVGAKYDLDTGQVIFFD